MNILQAALGNNLIGLTPEIFEKFQQYYRMYWLTDQAKMIINASQPWQNHRHRVLQHIEKSVSSLVESGISTSNTTAFLMIGDSGSNGHAFLSESFAIAFYSIELYDDDLFAKVFVLHELIHAVHYRNNPQFFFTSFAEKEHLGRSLISEGVATYVSKTVGNLTLFEALWGGKIPIETYSKWQYECEENADALCKFCLLHFNSSSHSRLFYAGNTDDIFASRGGYWLGYQMISEIVEKNGYSLKELLKISRSAMEKHAMRWLQKKSVLTL